MRGRSGGSDPGRCKRLLMLGPQLTGGVHEVAPRSGQHWGASVDVHTGEAGIAGADQALPDTDCNTNLIA